jgi:hypothetical protein
MFFGPRNLLSSLLARSRFDLLIIGSTANNFHIGANLLPRSTRHGMAMVFSRSVEDTDTCATYLAETWAVL